MFAPRFRPLAKEISAEALVNRKLALVMLNAGWDIDIITWNVQNIGKPVVESSWDEPWIPLKNHTHELPYKNGMSRTLNGIAKIAFNSVRYGFILKGIGILDKEIALALKLHNKEPYDFVISRANPESAHLPALFFSRKTGAPWIANWNDPAPSYFPEPYIKEKQSFFHKLFLKRVSLAADYHTFPSDRLGKYIAAYIDEDISDKSLTVPHVAMKFDIKSGQTRDKRSFIISYAGYLDHKIRKIDTFLKAFSIFIKKYNLSDCAKLRIICDNDAKLLELAQNSGIAGNIEFTGQLSYIDSLKAMSGSDILLIIEAQLKEGIFLPSKLSDYVQTGHHILALSPKTGAVNDVLSNGGGTVVDPGASADEIASLLGELYEGSKAGRLSSSERLFEYFCPDKIISLYESIFVKLQKKRGLNVI